MLQRLKLEHLPCQLSKTLCTALAPPLCAPTEIWAHQRALIMWFLSLRDHERDTVFQYPKAVASNIFSFFICLWLDELVITSYFIMVRNGLPRPFFMNMKKKKGILGILSLRPQAISSSFTFVIISETGILILFLYCY